MRQIPDQKTLLELVHYCPETGVMTWRERGEEWFDNRKGRAKITAVAWNKKFAGKAAFATPTTSGHLKGRLFRRELLAHRVAWKLVYGVDPNEIDHIDGCGWNNALENMRNVSRAENLQNVALSKRNKSGVIGVCWASRDRHWVAYIHANGEFIKIGIFPEHEFDAAVAARKAAEIKHGFHPNHGRTQQRNERGVAA